MRIAIFLLLAAALPVFAAERSARVIAEVDVAVAGGTTYGVAAALSAARNGKTVMIVAPRSGLGEDTAGTLRLMAPGGVRTPLSIKRSLDQALADAGVTVRCWTQPIGILSDEEGNVTGLEVAGRDGFSVVRAKEVIDATPLAGLARRAGAIGAAGGGSFTVAQNVVSGSKPKADGLVVTRLADIGVVTAADAHMSPQIAPAADAPSSVDAALWRCERRFDFPDLSARTLLRVEQEMRDATWTRDQAACAEFCYLVDPPEWYGKAHRVTKVSVPYSRGREIIADADVLVVGGGTSGAPAAIAAARNGARVVCVEFAGRLGGVATDGGIGRYCLGLRRGFTTELDREVSKIGSFYSCCKAEWLRSEGRRHGAEYMFCSQAVGAYMENGRVAGAWVALPDGTCGIVRAKAVIDATGYALVAADAGEETEFLSAAELSVQGAGAAPKILGRSLINTDAFFIDDVDSADLSYEWARARKSYATDEWDQSSVVSSRERRRMKGAYRVTVQDVMADRNYPDVISLAYSNFDTHGQTVDPEFFIEIPHRKNYVTARVPYRAILPARTDGLLVVGLGMSAHRDAMPVLRMQADLQNQGYAAGLAAAQAVRTGKALRDIDVGSLQRELVKCGILTDDDLKAPENLPLSDEALARAVDGLGHGYEGLARVLSDVPRAMPMLEKARREAKDSESKLVYAHVLGILGSASGTEEIVTAIDALEWDEGWNYRGMGQYGRSTSRVDSLLIALGCRANRGNAAAIGAVRRKAVKLVPESAYSHYRAIVLAVERIGDKALVPDIVRLLGMKGVAGHAFKATDMPAIPGYDGAGTHIGVANDERNDCLRELSLARALYHLGDSEGRGAAILRAYAEDPRRIYAAHAKAVLTESRF